MRRLLFGLVLATAMVVAIPGVASATQPSVTSIHVEGTDAPVEDCGTFTALLTFTNDETITTFYDTSGVPTREQIRFNFSGTFTNSVTGKAADELGNYSIFVDLVSGQAQTVGLELLIHMPGSGVVTLELGSVQFDGGTISNVGSPTILDDGSLICSILA